MRLQFEGVSQALIQGTEKGRRDFAKLPQDDPPLHSSQLVALDDRGDLQPGSAGVWMGRIDGEVGGEGTRRNYGRDECQDDIIAWTVGPRNDYRGTHLGTGQIGEWKRGQDDRSSSHR